MITRKILPAVLGVVMLGTPVLAGNTYNAATPSGQPAQHEKKVVAMTPAEQCTSLETQFDAAIKTHGNAAKANEAKTMRTEGGNLCASGKQAEGIAKLEHALKDLGVKVKG